MNNLIEKITQTTEPSNLFQSLMVNLPIKLGLMLLAVALITKKNPRKLSILMPRWIGYEIYYFGSLINWFLT